MTITYSLAAAFAFAIWTVFHSLIAIRLDNLTAAVLISGVGSITGIIILLYTGQLSESISAIKGNQYQILFFIFIAGVSVLAIDFFALQAYNLKQSVTIVAPIIMTGSVIISSTIGIIFLSESLTITKITGIAMSAIGIYLVTISTI